MAEFVDFAELKQCVAITDVLRHYGILDSLRVRKGGDELAGKCPWHTSSSSDPFRVSVSKNAFHCFGCNAQGNVIGLVEAHPPNKGPILIAQAKHVEVLPFGEFSHIDTVYNDVTIKLYHLTSMQLLFFPPT